MHLEALVEEPSAEAALISLLPKILGEGPTFRIHPHQGKADLLGSLERRLRGYARWLPSDWRIVVVVDEDRTACRRLKDMMEATARSAGLVTKSRAGGGPFAVLNRIAIEELEAWFLGDVPALRRAFPRIPLSLAQRDNYRDPDAVVGGTWEALERILKRHGYYLGGMPKVEVARLVSQGMEVGLNRSRSFQIFRDGVAACAR